MLYGVFTFKDNCRFIYVFNYNNLLNYTLKYCTNQFYFGLYLRLSFD